MYLPCLLKKTHWRGSLQVLLRHHNFHLPALRPTSFETAGPSRNFGAVVPRLLQFARVDELLKLQAEMVIYADPRCCRLNAEFVDARSCDGVDGPRLEDKIPRLRNRGKGIGPLLQLRVLLRRQQVVQPDARQRLVRLADRFRKVGAVIRSARAIHAE